MSTYKHPMPVLRRLPFLKLIEATVTDKSQTEIDERWEKERGEWERKKKTARLYSLDQTKVRANMQQEAVNGIYLYSRKWKISLSAAPSRRDIPVVHHRQGLLWVQRRKEQTYFYYFLKLFPRWHISSSNITFLLLHREKL